MSLSLCSFHQEGSSLGFFSEGPGVLDAAQAKKTRWDRDPRGLFLGDVSSSVCNGGGGQGKGAVTQTLVFPS